MINDKVLSWIKKVSKKYILVICVGGGTQISEAFSLEGLKNDNFGPLGRETSTLKEKQLARDVLEKNKEKLENKLKERNICASVVIPVIEIGNVLCHVNGDQFALTAYHGFDLLFIVTTKERLEKKKEDFSDYDKIKIMFF